MERFSASLGPVLASWETDHNFDTRISPMESTTHTTKCSHLYTVFTTSYDSEMQQIALHEGPGYGVMRQWVDMRLVRVTHGKASRRDSDGEQPRRCGGVERANRRLVFEGKAYICRGNRSGSQVGSDRLVRYRPRGRHRTGAVGERRHPGTEAERSGRRLWPVVPGGGATGDSAVGSEPRVGARAGASRLTVHPDCSSLTSIAPPTSRLTCTFQGRQQTSQSST